MGSSISTGHSCIVCKECNIGCEVQKGFEGYDGFSFKTRHRNRDSVIANECEHYKFDIDVYTSTINIQFRLNALCKKCHFKKTYSAESGSTGNPYSKDYISSCKNCNRNEEINYKFDFSDNSNLNWYEKRLNPRFEVYICYKVIQENAFIKRKLPLISHWICVLKSEKNKFYFTHLQASAQGGDAAKNGKIYLEFGDFEKFLSKNGMQNVQIAYTYIGMTEKSKSELEKFVNADKTYANTTYDLLLNNCQDWVKHFVHSLGINFNMISLNQLVSSSTHFANSYREIKPNNDYEKLCRNFENAAAMN